MYLTLLLLLKMTSAQQMPSKAEREKYVSPDKYKYAPLWVRAASCTDRQHLGHGRSFVRCDVARHCQRL